MPFKYRGNRMTGVPCPAGGAPMGEPWRTSPGKRASVLYLSAAQDAGGTDSVGDFDDPDNMSFLFDAPAEAPAPDIPEEADATPRRDGAKKGDKDKKEKKQKKEKKDSAREKKQKDAPVEKNNSTALAVAPAEKKPVRFWRAFPAAIALLFPLAYLFFDLFIVYGEALFTKPSGITSLQQFIERATSAAYDTSSASELILGTFGENVSIYTPVSVSALSGETAYSLPLLAVLIPVALSALAGVLILATGARLLRNRVFLDLTMLAGLAASFAPLLGETAYAFSLYVQTKRFSTVNSAMARFGLSVEAMLMLCICALLVLPALRRLRRIGDEAAGRAQPVILPCAALGARFFPAKLLALLMTLACLAFAILFLVGPVYSPDLDPAAWSVTGLLTTVGDTIRLAFSGGEGVSAWTAIPALLVQLLLALQIPVLAILCVPLLIQLFRVLFTGKHISPKERDKKKHRSPGEVTASAARSALLLPYFSFLIFSAVAVLLVLFFSHLTPHIDLSDRTRSIEILYLAIAYVRSLGGTTCAYTLLMTVGAPLWHLAGNFHNAMESHRIPRFSGRRASRG